MPIPHAHLRSFHAVALHGSFTRAAEMLNITQPTLSGQVKELEERYGTQLFVRQGRRIELTDIGRAAFDITRIIFTHEKEVENLFQSARALTTGQLRVAADSPYIVTPLLAQFNQRYPGIQLSIQYGNSKQLMKWLDSHQCDIALLPNIPLDDERLFSIPLQPDRLVVFVNKQHAWAKRKLVALKDLKTQRVILREKGSRTRSIFQEALDKANIKLDDVMEISGREGVREAVAVGIGIGIVAENELQDDNRLCSLRVKNAELIHNEHVLCLKDAKALRVNDAFLSMIMENQG
ncbi:MAG: aminoethylphosphonate catabolism LysR family transcriptional regulator [Gammaproteobacteria bacterium]|jgi:aminoethylphosphonate catabolism LysR family transcriptional regulator